MLRSGGNFLLLLFIAMALVSRALSGCSSSKPPIELAAGKGSNKKVVLDAENSGSLRSKPPIELFAKNRNNYKVVLDAENFVRVHEQDGVEFLFTANITDSSWRYEEWRGISNAAHKLGYDVVSDGLGRFHARPRRLPSTSSSSAAPPLQRRLGEDSGVLYEKDGWKVWRNGAKELWASYGDNENRVKQYPADRTDAFIWKVPDDDVSIEGYSAKTQTFFKHSFDSFVWNQHIMGAALRNGITFSPYGSCFTAKEAVQLFADDAQNIKAFLDSNNYVLVVNELHCAYFNFSNDENLPQTLRLWCQIRDAADKLGYKLARKEGMWGSRKFMKFAGGARYRAFEKAEREPNNPLRFAGN